MDLRYQNRPRVTIAAAWLLLVAALAGSFVLLGGWPQMHELLSTSWLGWLWVLASAAGVWAAYAHSIRWVCVFALIVVAARAAELSQLWKAGGAPLVGQLHSRVDLGYLLAAKRAFSHRVSELQAVPSEVESTDEIQSLQQVTVLWTEKELMATNSSERQAALLSLLELDLVPGSGRSVQAEELQRAEESILTSRLAELDLLVSKQGVAERDLESQFEALAASSPAERSALAKQLVEVQFALQRARAERQALQDRLGWRRSQLAYRSEAEGSKEYRAGMESVRLPRIINGGTLAGIVYWCASVVHLLAVLAGALFAVIPFDRRALRLHWIFLFLLGSTLAW